MEPTRLSRKAQEEVERLTAEISREIRKVASCRAHNEEREFADLSDVHWATPQVLSAVMSRHKIGFEDSTAY